MTADILHMAIGLAHADHLTGYDSYFDQSYERVKRIEKNGKTFFEAFYDNFCAATPEVANHFRNTDMKKQKKMLEKSFYGLFIFYATNNANDYLCKIAQHHSQAGKDIPPDLYDVWLDSLIKTVSEYDPMFDMDIELSWRVVLSAGITYMKFKYDK
jgi:hemoglobin-like flavoprotein